MALEEVQLLGRSSCRWDPSSHCPLHTGTEWPFLPISVNCLLSPLPAQLWGHSGLGGLLGLACPTSPAGDTKLVLPQQCCPCL